ncbi:GntR family transcriptional regulator, partial [Rugosimonospora africana]|uniref:GntR family transcriptional regulator n=1 Tax=Rugosimonospora africana TaxID=556532 RepID=UPI001945555D
MRYQQPLMFPVSLDRRQARPLWQQLADQICSAVDRGVLAAGTRMPSTRTLAALLGVSRGVPMEAYELLFESGYAESRPGSGTYVTVPARLAAPAPVRTPPGRVPPGGASPGNSTAGSSTAGNSTAGPVARPAPSRHAARMARGYSATRGAARRPAGLGRGVAPDSRGAAPDAP